MTDTERKAQIKAVMVTHLTTKGYPKMTTARIIQELKPMWVALEESGLLMPGMSYKGFCMQARMAGPTRNDLSSFMEEFLRAGGL